MTSPPAIDRLIQIMRRLRDPDGGCPWDLEQTFRTIAPYTIEEAYEVAEAIADGDMTALRHELGDLLLQVVYHAQMASEAGAFAFDDVVMAISDKMVARHRHVFGPAEILSAEAQTGAWEDHKAAERARRAVELGRAPGVLDAVPLALPALTRAEKLQKRAARVGFDWPDVAEVHDKLAEELGELRHEVDIGAPSERLADELGDVLFAVTNLARHLGVDPEAALRGTNAKFERRFRWIEGRLAEQGRSPEEASLAEMEALWLEGKDRERPE
ncbi:MAG: nucleoside triphosphate pyrophosphohydrolase [Alphaproteobacteria bacterium]|nr:nucleoside triphosphate pyrophosphohydrolase [Alphaproteobacteria bacterium]